VTSEPRRARRRRRKGTDEGLSLIEVLISLTLIGTLMTVMAGTIAVVLRQKDNTEGRLNNSRSEEALGLWMPTDLASAQDVNVDPAASACGSSCTGNLNAGSSALYLSWTTKQDDGSTGIVDVVTKVTYRYLQDGDEWILLRVECVTVGAGSPTCRSNVVVHDLDPPPDADHWVAGSTVPSWVIQVSIPLDPADPGNTGTTVPVDPNAPRKNAQRVIVTVNGGGDTSGRGGGINQISLSAGGTNRSVIDATSTVGTPSFTQARSRCGGNIVLVVDTSNSIGSTAMGQVRTAVGNFVHMFAGTPVKLQVIRFSTTSSAIGTTGWSKYYDMLNDSEVTTLYNAVTDPNIIKMDGGTNWEDAFFRTFKNQDGTQPQIIPDMVVFFTDGVPTYDRSVSSSTNSSSVANPPPPTNPEGYDTPSGSSYAQRAWNRANYWVSQYRTQVRRLIGVGIGPDIGDPSLTLAQNKSNGDTSKWQFAPDTYQKKQWERAYHLQVATYQRAFHYLQAFHLEYRTSKNASWQPATQTQYNNASGSNRRIVTGVLLGSPNTSYNQWDAVDKATYDATTANARQISYTWSMSETPVQWENVSQSVYNSTASDHRQIVWQTVDEATYNAATGSKQKSYTASMSLTPAYWEVTTKTTYNNTASDHRRTTWISTTQADYNANSGSSDYQKVDGATTDRENYKILEEIITGGSATAIRATLQGGVYTNADVADSFISPDWTQFGNALQAIALSECGATLTLQTKLGSASAADPFTYQTTSMTDSTGAPIEFQQTVVTTSRQFPSGTFDYDIPSGKSVTVEIQPQNLDTLKGYTPAATPWVCKAGANAKSFTTVPISGSAFTGIRVTVSANEAVSCLLQVVRT
jgi:hypothetical protein